MTPNKKTPRPAAAAGTLAVLLAAPFAFVGSAQAATITVGTQCSLPNAVASAEANADTGGCTGTGQYGDDTIIIPPNQPQVLTEPVSSERALPVITSRITIEGRGNPIRIQPPEGSSALGFARIDSGSLTINDATLRGGNNGTAGSIHAAGGTTVLNRVTLTDNTTSGGAGAILVGSGASVTLNNSTVVNNGATAGAGTGGIQCNGTLTLNNSTVTGNYSPNSSRAASGIDVSGTAALTINNSIVAGNYVGSPGAPPTYNKPGVDVTGGGRRPPEITARYSLFGHAGIQGTGLALSNVKFTASSTGNLVLDGSSATPTELRDILEVDASNLPVLKDNGGPLHTVALVTGSPAINAADPLFTDSTPTAGTALRRDQRRYLLADGDTRRDIGAFELGGLPPVAPSAPTGLSVTPGDGSLTIAFTPGAAGTAPITNYAYALGDSTTFTALDPADGESPVTISGLTNGTRVTVRLKAISEDGESAASVSVSGTPNVPGICDLFVVDGVTNVIDLRRAASGQTVRGVSGRFNVIYGSGFADTITGGNAGNCIDAGAGNDRLTAGSGENHLYGGAGNDTLTPGSGSTAMDGGPGTDKCLRASSRASATYASCESF